MDLERAVAHRITLRDVRDSDLPALYALDQLCYRSGIAYSIQEMRYYLRRRGAVSILAEDSKGLLAGFAIAEPVRYGRSAAGHIITIDVAPERLRQGIGTLLMDAMESRLAGAGVTLLRLEVAVDNPAAQQFYRSRGFVQRETIRGYYMGTLDALVMEKLL